MLFILFVAMIGSSWALPSEILKVTNGGSLGVWGKPEFCANNTYAIGYDMKIEGKQGFFGDDTALNGIKLICKSKDHPDNTVNYAKSTVGPWGKWVGETHCANGIDGLISFTLQVESQKATDGTSANFVKFRCRDLAGYSPSYDMSKTPGHGIWGKYGAWSSECPVGKAICGLKTRVEVPKGLLADDSALNDVVFYCC